MFGLRKRGGSKRPSAQPTPTNMAAAGGRRHSRPIHYSIVSEGKIFIEFERKTAFSCGAARPGAGRAKPADRPEPPFPAPFPPGKRHDLGIFIKFWKILEFMQDFVIFHRNCKRIRIRSIFQQNRR